MSIFPTATEARAIFAPIVVDAAEQLGSRADIYELVAVRQLDGTSKRVPNLLIQNDVPIRIKVMKSEEVQEIFGLNPNVTMKGSMPRVAEVAIDNVFDVQSGDFAGQRFQVKSVFPKVLSNSYVLGLVDYEAQI